jgi:hypothetical protein
MIPPSALQFTLWGSALYAELTAGLWRALAAPWLPPGWPAPPLGAPDRRRPPFEHAAARSAPAARSLDSKRGPARGERGEELGSSPDARAGSVIEVPRGRWQRRRADRGSLPNEG